MKRLLIALAFLSVGAPVWAADNFTVSTVGGNVVLRSHDIGSGVQSGQYVQGDAAGNVCVVTSGGTPGCFEGFILSTGNGATPDHYIANAGGNQDSHNWGTNASKLLVGAQLANLSAVPYFAKFYNKQSCASTDTPLKVLIVPGNTAGAGNNWVAWSGGDQFGTALCTRFTTGIADNDTTAVATQTALISISYY